MRPPCSAKCATRRAIGNGVQGVTNGTASAVRLAPNAGLGAPTTGSHEAGELVIDANGDFFVCTAAGTPGTWRQLAFV